MSNQRETPLILIADDDEDILQLVVFRIKRAGYEVVEARDGEEALRLAIEQEPDLAILDVGMPKLSGYEVTSSIRKHERISRIPVIMLTANVQDTSVTRGFEAGADDYVKKPFSPPELLLRVQTALGRR